MKYILHFNPMKYILHFNPMKYILHFNPMKYILHFNPMKYILIFNPMKYILHFDLMKYILLWYHPAMYLLIWDGKIYSISVAVCVCILLQITWQNVLLLRYTQILAYYVLYYQRIYTPIMRVCFLFKTETTMVDRIPFCWSRWQGACMQIIC
jgi:hypothetical protein